MRHKLRKGAKSSYGEWCIKYGFRYYDRIIPEDWLKSEFEKYLTEEELAEIDSLGGLEKLLEEFKNRMKEQQSERNKHTITAKLHH